MTHKAKLSGVFPPATTPFLATDEAVDAAIAIHGGTGLSDEVFNRCIALGGVKVNISTQIKHLFRDSLAQYFADNPDGYEPVKILAYMRDETQPVVEAFIHRFGSTGKV